MRTSVLVLDIFPGHCTINIYVAVKPQPSFAKEQIPEQLIDEYPLLLGKLSLAFPSAGFLASIKEWALLFIMGLLIFNSTSFFRIKKLTIENSSTPQILWQQYFFLTYLNRMFG